MSETIENPFTPEVQAKLDALKSRLAEREAPIEQIAAPAVSEQAAMQAPKRRTGADEDWSKYDLPNNLAHFYPRAIEVETQDGPQWVYVHTQFYSRDCNIGAEGSRDKKGVPINLGEFLTYKLMSNEGWKISGIIPATLGRCAVLLERQNPISLPQPRLLQTTTPVAAPTEGEIDEFDAASEAWTKSLTPATEPATIEAPVDLTGAVEGE